MLKGRAILLAIGLFSDTLNCARQGDHECGEAAMMWSEVKYL